MPILTPYKDSRNIGRIDPDYVYDKLMNVMRYGNLADPRVYVDEFTQYNLKVSRAREAFARVAREYILLGEDARAEELLDRGLEVLPISQLRFTEPNTYPFIECYYALGLNAKGDALSKAYITNLIEYIDYYMQFDGKMIAMIENTIYDRLDELELVYCLAAKYQRDDVVQTVNRYYRSLGYTDEELILTPQEKEALAQKTEGEALKVNI